MVNLLFLKEKSTNLRQVKSVSYPGTRSSFE